MLIKVVNVMIGATKDIGLDENLRITQKRRAGETKLNEAVARGYEIIDCTAVCPNGYIIMIYTLQRWDNNNDD